MFCCKFRNFKISPGTFYALCHRAKIIVYFDPVRFQNDNSPRSASVGRPMVNGTPQRIVSTSGVEDVVLRRPTTNGHSLTSTPARRPKTTTTEVQQSFGLPSANGVSPMQPSPNQRHSTCTLHLNDTVSSNIEDRTLKNKTNRHSQEEENEEEDGEETVSGTLDDETSDDGMLPDDRGFKNIDGGAKRISTSGEIQRPDLNCVLSREHRCECFNRVPYKNIAMTSR